jgi:predicted ATP-dependent endonuclease of OLD family
LSCRWIFLGIAIGTLLCRVPARAEEDAERVILIDEPGLYLHARAQQDVLDVLDRLADSAPVIFSTHSPYLLDADRFDRIRLVIKEDNGGTRIQNKVHAEADAETLTPIITAAGLDVARQFSQVGSKNVLLEGISDYYYLQSYRSLLQAGALAELSLVPAVGAQNVPQLASLLIGWDVPFVALLDNDVEGRRAAKKLREKLSVPPGRILGPTDTDGEATEDVLTAEDFDKYVLAGEERPHEPLNSKAVKSGGFDSVLLSVKFRQRILKEPASVRLSAESKKRIRGLFKRLAEAFEVER